MWKNEFNLKIIICFTWSIFSENSWFFERNHVDEVWSRKNKKKSTGVDLMLIKLATLFKLYNELRGMCEAKFDHAISTWLLSWGQKTIIYLLQKLREHFCWCQLLHQRLMGRLMQSSIWWCDGCIADDRLMQWETDCKSLCNIAGCGDVGTERLFWHIE